MIQTNWYVLTGGQHSGKSTLLEEIAGRGYTTFPELGPEIFSRELAKGRSMEEIGYDPKIQQEFFDRKKDLENRLNPRDLVFFDTGIPFSHYFFGRVGLDQNEVVQEAQKRRYRRVFFLDPIPNHQTTDARLEKEDEAAQVAQHLKGVYATLGYHLEHVPLLPVEERADYIVNFAKKDGLL